MRVLLCIGVKCSDKDGEFDKVINIDSIFNLDALSKSRDELLTLASKLYDLKRRLEKGEAVDNEIMSLGIIPEELKELIDNADNIDEIHIRSSSGIRPLVKSILGSALKDKSVIFE